MVRLSIPENSSKMKQTLEQKVLECVAIESKRFASNNVIEQYCDSIRLFEHLIALGLTTKRESNLLSPSDYMSVNKLYFNR